MKLALLRILCIHLSISVFTIHTPCCRFPLNGYSKVTAMQVMTQLLAAHFSLATSSGGGVEGQQFSEYVFTRHQPQHQ